MKQFFKRVLRSLGLVCKEPQVKIRKEIVEELAKPPVGETSYIPYPDEPSVFDLDPDQPSMIWVNWARRKFFISLEQAMDQAVQHKRWLFNSPPRKVNTMVVPDILIPYRARGVEQLVLSLEWVIWCSNAHQMSLQEAHAEGVFLTTRAVSLNSSRIGQH